MKEFKIGMMVIFGLSMLAGLIISSGGNYFYQKGYTIKTCFSQVSGLDKGAPVRVAGMEVGEVKGLEIIDKKVWVCLWLKDSAKIRTDSRVTVNSLGIVGEKYVEITMGDRGSYLKDGQSIIGVNPVNMEEIFSRTEAIVYKSEKLVAILDKMLGGEETWLEIDNTIRNAATFTASLNELMVENKGKINQSMSNLARLTTNLDRMVTENSQDVKIATAQFKEAATQLKKASSQATAQFDRTLGNIDKTVSDSKKELTVTLGKIENAATALGTVLKEVEKGQGALGRMVVDKKMAEDLSQAISNLNVLSKDLREHPWKLMREERKEEQKKGFFHK